MKPRMQRTIEHHFKTRAWFPGNKPTSDEGVALKPEEAEAIRLSHGEQLSHKAGGERMGVSRATFGRDLENGLAKIAEAMAHGKAIVIEK